MEKELIEKNVYIMNDTIHFTVPERNMQFLMDQVYLTWQFLDSRDRKRYSKHEICNKFTEYHRLAVVLGNFNYQVGNGGTHQWVFNRYPFEDYNYMFPLFEKIKKDLDKKGFYNHIVDNIYSILESIRADIFIFNESGEVNIDCEYCNGDGYEIYMDEDEEEIEEKCFCCGGSGISSTKNINNAANFLANYIKEEDSKIYNEWLDLFESMVLNYEKIKAKDYSFIPVKIM